MYIVDIIIQYLKYMSVVYPIIVRYLIMSSSSKYIYVRLIQDYQLLVQSLGGGSDIDFSLSMSVHMYNTLVIGLFELYCVTINRVHELS